MVLAFSYSLNYFVLLLGYFTLQAGSTKVGTGKKILGFEKVEGNDLRGNLLGGDTHQGYHVNLPST